MSEVTTIGLDLAKEPCLIGMEACATAHYWARELARLGHQVRLIPPAGACPRAAHSADPWAKAYVRRNKNDPADAAAICEAVSRPQMRFVAIKSEEQQAAAGIHKSLPSRRRGCASSWSSSARR